MAIIEGKTYMPKPLIVENSKYNSLLIQYIMFESDLKKIKRSMKKIKTQLDEILLKETNALTE